MKCSPAGHWFSLSLSSTCYQNEKKKKKKKKEEEEEESFIDMASCECKYLLQAGKGHKSQLMDCFENG